MSVRVDVVSKEPGRNDLGGADRLKWSFAALSSSDWIRGLASHGLEADRLDTVWPDTIPDWLADWVDTDPNGVAPPKPTTESVDG
jgi:hypothetical protein